MIVFFQLTVLDVSGCTALETLVCFNNRLTVLDVSQNLKYLYCNNNQLAVLDISRCPELLSAYNSTRTNSDTYWIYNDDSGNRLAVDKSTVVKTEANPALTITSQPQDFTGELNSYATFTVEARGEGLTYLWESYDGTKWGKTNFATSKTDTLKVKITAVRDGKQYRCVVTDANGNTVASEPATLHVG